MSTDPAMEIDLTAVKLLIAVIFEENSPRDGILEGEDPVWWWIDDDRYVSKHGAWLMEECSDGSTSKISAADFEKAIGLVCGMRETVARLSKLKVRRHRNL